MMMILNGTLKLTKTNLETLLHSVYIVSFVARIIFLKVKTIRNKNNYNTDCKRMEETD